MSSAAKKKVPAKGKSAKKPNKVKTAKKPPPHSGQSAEERDIPFNELNSKEKELLTVLNAEGSGACPRFTLKEITEAAFLPSRKVPTKKPSKSEIATPAKIRANSWEQASSWTRNCLRRLTISGYVVKIERGIYKISAKGRKRIATAE